MARFSVRIDVEPEDIPKLDDAHKRDCADAINKVINKTFKYTLIFMGVVMAYYAAYSLFAFPYLMRMGKMLPQMNALIPVVAILIFFFEFIAGTMKRWAVALVIFLHIIITVLSVSGYQSLPIIPFAIYGIILHINLFGFMPHYDVLSNLKGYPDFTSLPIGDVIKKVPAEENKETASEQEEKTPVSTEKDVQPEEKIPVSADNSGTDQKDEKAGTPSAGDKRGEENSRQRGKSAANKKRKGKK